jgi:ABC-type branched-subunit amino acid transport system substrate-binding protein
MPSLPLRLIALSCGLALPLFGCNAVLGLDKLSIESHADDAGHGKGGATSTETPDGGEKGDCETNQECTTRLSMQSGANDANDSGVVPAVCVKNGHHCVALLSEDCNAVEGDYLNDHAVILGTLFSTKGAQSATNIPRQNSAVLAVEEINNVGGVPGPTIDAPRPLVLVSCDESTNLARAGGHLITDLHVPAIVGPNTSQDTLDLSNKLSIAGGTVVMTPTGVASSIADLTDNDLTWLMVPTDVQRAPLMISQINALETQLKQARSESKVKLGVIYRNDALGVGTRTSLDPLIFNGKPLSDSVNVNNNVNFTGYDYTQPDQSAIVSNYLKFLPDIIVLAGTAEAITKVMVPLEQQWPKSESDAGRRPYYVLIDSVKVPELISAVTNNDDLRRRVRGTGVTPSPSSAAVYNAFQIDFTSRYPGISAKTSGMGPSYDALYGIAYALAATKDMPATGTGIAAGLRKLAGGATTIQNSGTKALAAFQKLSAGDKITAIGTFGPMEWDVNGAVVGGTLEMWCIDGSGSTPAYQGSGLTYDIKAQTFAGSYMQCGP